MTDIKAEVRDFLTKTFYLSNPADLSDDASLLDLGVIDSTGVLEVIEFLETQFQIRVEDAEMVPENLDSIARIAQFVARKREVGTRG